MSRMIDHSAATSVRIPALSVGPLVEDEHGVLLWVHTGTAGFEAGTTRITLGAGAALWVPPGIEHRTRTEPGAVVFPYLLQLDALPGILGEVHVVRIPRGWEEWLIHRWDDNSAASAALPDVDALLWLVARPNASVPRPVGVPEALTLPRSREARAVALTLLDDPAGARDLAWFADRERVSARTIQRQFRRETGTTFADWRSIVRIGIAARRLSEGHAVAPTAREVGFRTTAGFSHAFRRRTGVAPRTFRSGSREHRSGSDAHAPMPPSATESDDTVRVAPIVPARTFWGTVSERHELVWVFRGTVTVHVGPHRRVLRRGQAVWVPAGAAHAAEFERGSVMLSLGRLPGHLPIGQASPHVIEFPPEWEPFLLHTVLAEFSLFRPEQGQGSFVRDLFDRRLASSDRGSSGLGGAIGDMAAMLRRDPADARSLAEWANRYGTTSVLLGAAFLALTGESFPRWRSRIRMDVARDHLQRGRAPGVLHSELGYSSQAAFTRAFTTAHGISPGAYQRRESRWLELPPA